MTAIEERVRAAAQAAASQVREVRPLALPAGQPVTRTPPPGRRWQGWLVPLAAAAAVVVVIALSLAITHQVQSGSALPGTGHGTPPAPVCGGSRLPADPQAPPVPADVPQYFVEVCAELKNFSPEVGGPGRLVAADTRTGAILGSVAVPSGGGYVFSGIYGTAGDRAFVVDATSEASKGQVTAWWELRLAPGTAHPVQFTRLPWTLADVPLSFAVSPDGTKIAAALSTTVPGSAGLRPVRLYSLATGAVLRSWTFKGQVFHLAWTGDGRALAYQGNGPTLELHDIATPGSDLAAGSTPLISIGSTPVLPGNPAECAVTAGWTVSADGSTVICAAASLFAWPPPSSQFPRFISPSPTPSPSPSATSCTGASPAHLAFLRYTAGSTQPDSSPAGTDYSATDPCLSNPDAISLWWASPDGTTVIGQLNYPGHNDVGVFSDGTYIPLPAIGGGTPPPEPWMIAF
ncbi:MAG: hypothetical protein JWM19_6740 [Actinomycetia bacterium]|nr:hypothetical protein [Actinomycetes bacterium]